MAAMSGWPRPDCSYEGRRGAGHLKGFTRRRVLRVTCLELLPAILVPVITRISTGAAPGPTSPGRGPSRWVSTWTGSWQR